MILLWIITVLIAASIPFYFWRKERQRAKYYKAGKSYWKQCAKENDRMLHAWKYWGLDSDLKKSRLMDVLEYVADNLVVQGNEKGTGRLIVLSKPEILKGDFSRTNTEKDFRIRIFSDHKAQNQ